MSKINGKLLALCAVAFFIISSVVYTSSGFNTIVYTLLFIIFVLGIVILRKIQKEIFERKKIDILQEHEALVDLSNDAIISIDPNFNILVWNVGAENFYGYSKKDAIGQPMINIVKTKVSEEAKQEMIASLKETGQCL